MIDVYAAGIGVYKGSEMQTVERLGDLTNIQKMAVTT